MPEEEYFRKNYPDSCYGDKPLSPHWDFFQDGVEFGERQSEKRISDLEATNKTISNECHKLVDSLEKKQNEVAELEERNRELLESCEGATMMYKDLCKAKEIIRDFLSVAVDYIDEEDKNYSFIAEAEQFLKENE